MIKKFQQYLLYLLITKLFEIFKPINDSSDLPQFTNTWISLFRIIEKDISATIKSLDPTKAHGWDNISLRITQICGDSLTLPLKLIFGSSLKEGTFPEIWKYANVVPVHKKERKKLLKSYFSVSLLPLFGNIFELVIYTTLFLIISSVANLLHLCDHVSFQVTRALLNYFL